MGKTTTARRLADGVTDGVCIHGDALADFIVSRSEDRPLGMSYVAAATLAETYLAAGYLRVVVDYVFEHSGHLNRFREALTTQSAVHYFTLWAPLHVVVDREANRPDRDRMGSRTAECWAALNANLDCLGTIVDADRPLDDVVGDLE